MTCTGARPYNIADRAVRVLETSDRPLPWWDVKRVLDRDHSTDHKKATVTAVLASDLRTCWAGKGVYGLYRHGQLPGVRTLPDVAEIYIHAYQATLGLEELAFILRRGVGYTFFDTSLKAALDRRPNDDLVTGRYRWSSGQATPQTLKIVAEMLRLDARPAIADEIVARAAHQVESSLAERSRRVDHRRNELSGERAE
jgi:hypothetical protein